MHLGAVGVWGEVEDGWESEVPDGDGVRGGAHGIRPVYRQVLNKIIKVLIIIRINLMK